MLRSTDFLFRPFEPGDACAFVDAVRESFSTLTTWMPWAHAGYAEADARAWIEHCAQGWMDRSSFEFGIFDAASGTLVGGCGLNQFNPLHGYCNLGYWVRESFHRRGAATRAVQALARFGFDELELGRIEIVVAVGNAASLGAARKAGAIEEGIARNRLRLHDRFVDAYMLALVPPMPGSPVPPDSSA
jgi:ribosomal-protein-serine acetyltransferase